MIEWRSLRTIDLDMQQSDLTGQMGDLQRMMLVMDYELYVVRSKGDLRKGDPHTGRIRRRVSHGNIERMSVAQAHKLRNRKLEVFCNLRIA